MSGRVMAIDFGSKRLGVAISDPSATVAQPLVVIERNGVREDLNNLEKLVNDYNIVRIVVGYPRTLAGLVGPQAAEVDVFITSLSNFFNLPIERFDERLSTKEAKARLSELGRKSDKTKTSIDKFAAALFLQSYLESRSGRFRL